MRNTHFKNLQEMNSVLKNYATKGKLEPSKSCQFLIKAGRLVVRFTDSHNHCADLCIGYFEANASSVKIVNKLIKKHSN